MPSVIVPIDLEGAIVEVLIGVSLPKAAALNGAGQPVPQPIKARLLVDTGASTTSIQAGMLNPLGISPTGSIAIHTASSAGTPMKCDQYDVSIVFPNGIPIDCRIPTVAISECQQLAGTIHGLLGRDILDRCVMSYNPHTGNVTLSF
jgi:hypothetical protein